MKNYRVVLGILMTICFIILSFTGMAIEDVTESLPDQLNSITSINVEQSEKILTSNAQTTTSSVVHLEIPQNIVATTTTTTTSATITITWNSVEGAENYDIEVDGQINNCGTITTYNHTDLEFGSTFTYRIRAVSSTQTGEWSQAIIAITDDFSSQIPKNIETTILGQSIKISWDNVNGADSYDIEVDGNIYTTINEEYEHINLEPNVQHTYRVRSRKANQWSNWSDEIIVMLPSFGGGDGTLENPYAIRYEEELQRMSTDLSAHYILSGDIDLGIEQWKPIGSAENPFVGSLDGNGYCINNISINQPTLNNQGLFGYVDGAIIKNLQLNNVEIEGNACVGAVIGYGEYATLENIEVNVGTIKGNEYIGGLLGYSTNGTIIRSSNKAEVISTNNTAGGLVGLASSITIEESYSAGNIILTYDQGGGLLGGLTGTSTIKNSYAIGDIIGRNYIGGLVGHFQEYDEHIQPTDPHDNGLHTNNSHSNNSNGNNQNNNNSNGNNQNNNNSNGNNQNNNGNNQNNNNSNGNNNNNNNSQGPKENVITIENCYSSGKVEGLSDVGGLTDENSGIIIINSYYDGIKSGLEICDSSSRLTTGMKRQSNYQGWDFDNIWMIEEDNSYPYLRNVNETDDVRIGLPTGDIAGGYGTEASPYIIKNQMHLHNIRYSLGMYYQLANDIELTEEWITVGSNKVSFTGTLDGNGYSINNLTINQPSSNYQGLLGKTDGAVIKNLELNNPVIEGNNYVGVLIGYGENSTVENVEVIQGTVTGNQNVGGLIGYSDAGSLSRNSCDAQVTAHHAVGGLIGYAVSTIIQESYTTGDVTVTSIQAGGLVGYLAGESSIQNSYSLADIKGSQYIGGLVGDTQYNGQHHGNTKHEDSISIVDCYYSGNIQDKNQGKGHGKDPEKNKIGGLIGSIDNVTVINSYFNSTLSDINFPNSQARTTEELLCQTTYEDWDFDGIWFIEEGKDYPQLINLLVPDNVTLNNVSTVMINTDWEDIKQAASYEIEINSGVIIGVKESQYIHIGLDAGTQYTYRVRIVTNTGVKCPWTKEYTFITLSEAPKEVQKVSTSKGLTLTWEKVKGAESYQIEVMDEILNLQKPTYEHENLSPNTQYSYRIRSINESGEGPWSTPIVYGTLSDDITGIQGEATEDSILIKWDAISGVSIYELEFDGVTNEVQTESFTITGLEANTNHSFRIRGKNNVGYNDWSEVHTIYTRLLTPENIQIVAEYTEEGIQNNKISWEDIEGADRYKLEINGVIQTVETNSYLHEEISANSVNKYRVKAENEYTDSQWSSQYQYTAAPKVPIIETIEVQEDQVVITWNHVEGAVAYQLDINNTIVDVGFTNTYTIVNPTEVTYQIRIRSINASATSLWSEVSSVDKLLEVPTNITAKAASDQIVLSWGEVVGAEAYELVVDDQVITVENDTTFIHGNLSPYTTHIYRVRALNANNISGWSDTCIIRTLVGIPSDLVADEITNESIKLTWAHEEGAEGYELNLGYKTVDVSDVAEYTHDGLEPNTVYSYRVRAYNQDGYGEWSKEIKQMTAPDTPTNITIEAKPTQLILTWDSVEGAVAYEVEVDGEIEVVKVTDAIYEHIELEPNTKHYYRVRAINEEVIPGPYSEEIEGRTQPEISIPVSKDNIFNFVIVVPVKEDISTRYINFYYDTTQLEVLDLCATTPNIDLVVGKIENTDITVISFEDGYIQLKVDNVDKTFTTTIQLQSLTLEEPRINYEIY